MGVKISDLTAASNVADANEFEINESGTSKKVTASQIKSYATNSTSVTAAGALMDSELADVSAVKGINQALTTTSAPTFNGMTTTGDITFGDNDRASFGAGDLLIFHDGSHSYLYETGTGEFRIKTNGNIIQFLDNSNNYLIKAAVGAEVGLYFNTAQKLVTTNTGCDISGTLTSDGLTVETAQGDISIPNSSTTIEMKRAGTNYIYATDASGNLRLGSGGVLNRLNIANNGAISFYEDTGSTPKLTWDASAERLGLGTAAPVAKIDIVHTGNTRMLFSEEATNTSTISTVNTANSAYSDLNVYANNLKLSTNGSERLRLTSSGSVGIGTSSVGSKLTIDGNGNGEVFKAQNTSGSATMRLVSSNTGVNYFNFQDTDGVGGQFLYNHTNNYLAIKTNNTERMRIDSNGNVGVGQSPNMKLNILHADEDGIRLNTADGAASFIDFGDASDNDIGRISYDHADNHMAFRTNNATRMAIDSNGNVGIACTPNSSSSGVAGLSIGDGGGPLGSLVSDGASNTETRLGHGYYFDGSNYKHETANVGVAIYQQLGNNAGAQHIWFSNAGGSEDATFTPTERMRIDSSGNVGIGTSSPTSLGNGSPLVVDNGATGDIAHFEGQGSVHLRIGENSNNMYINANNGNAVLAFQNNGTERMRIDSSGNVGIGCIPTYKFEVDSGGIVAAARLRRTTDATLRTVLLFLSSSNSNTVGSVSINNTSTSYNTSSDYRLKENVVDLTGATDRLKQLEPKRFNFIADADTTVDGFLAHEVQSVVPEAITGTHNEVDDDGNAVMQGIDQGKLVPLLTAALQEAIDKIEILETKVAALEGA